MANNNNNSSSSAFPPLDTNNMGVGGQGRNNASPITSGHPGSGSASANGNGAGSVSNYMATLPVGHQQDLNYLYNQIQELGSILRSNREQVNTITRTAEEVAVCFATTSVDHTCCDISNNLSRTVQIILAAATMEEERYQKQRVSSRQFRFPPLKKMHLLN